MFTFCIFTLLVILNAFHALPRVPYAIAQSVILGFMMPHLGVTAILITLFALSTITPKLDIPSTDTLGILILGFAVINNQVCTMPNVFFLMTIAVYAVLSVVSYKDWYDRVLRLWFTALMVLLVAMC